MPFMLKSVKVGSLTKYYVVNKLTGKKFSKEPMTKAKAIKQLQALAINLS